MDIKASSRRVARRARVFEKTATPSPHGFDSKYITVRALRSGNDEATVQVAAEHPLLRGGIADTDDLVDALESISEGSLKTVRNTVYEIRESLQAAKNKWTDDENLHGIGSSVEWKESYSSDPYYVGKTNTVKYVGHLEVYKLADLSKFNKWLKDLCRTLGVSYE